MDARLLQSDGRLPFWARLAISNRLGRRLSRRAAILRALFTTIVGDAVIIIGAIGGGPVGFLLGCLGVVACLFSLYYWIAIRWLDHNRAWRWAD